MSEALSFLDGGNTPIIGLSLLIGKLMERMQTKGYVRQGCYAKDQSCFIKSFQKYMIYFMKRGENKKRKGNY